MTKKFKRQHAFRWRLQQVISAIVGGPKTVDQIATATNKPQSEVRELLQDLRQRGMARPYPHQMPDQMPEPELWAFRKPRPFGCLCTPSPTSPLVGTVTRRFSGKEPNFANRPSRG